MGKRPERVTACGNSGEEEWQGRRDSDGKGEEARKTMRTRNAYMIWRGWVPFKICSPSLQICRASQWWPAEHGLEATLSSFRFADWRLCAGTGRRETDLGNHCDGRANAHSQGSRDPDLASTSLETRSMRAVGHGWLCAGGTQYASVVDRQAKGSGPRPSMQCCCDAGSAAKKIGDVAMQHADTISPSDGCLQYWSFAIERTRCFCLADRHKPARLLVELRIT